MGSYISKLGIPVVMFLMVGVYSISVFAISSHEVLDSSFCQNPSGRDCSFYSKCLEAAQSCGSDGYALGFGEPYCRRFKSNESFLSQRGRSFSVQTRLCLMQKLVPRMNFLIAKPEARTCESTKRYAYSTHVTCYTNHPDSICDLSPLTDLPVILSQMKFRDIFQKSGRTQIQAIAKICISRLFESKNRHQKSGNEFEAQDLDLKIRFWEKTMSEQDNE